MKTRPRGFVELWSPRPATVALLRQVEGVLETYRQHLPMTCRQIYYSLVGSYGSKDRTGADSGASRPLIPR